ncbi:sensor histidine kinase [Paenibacillus sp. FJAT-26967]|uniref:cache domain-containing sensor histidine kinase n=1 Tax=Paenibacillus sp. FJAT-26967 TaxID=1729690 RepID=UPI00083891AC|nr:sensor histidine kinase [Paenibacillus sp. FJAT-26967]
MKGASRLLQFYRGLKISQKLLLSYILLILLPTITISAISYQKTSKMLIDRVVESTQQSFEQANTFISYKLNNVKDVSSILYMNRSITEILGKSETGYSLGQQIDDYQKLSDIILSAYNSREIYSIRLFVDKDRVFLKDNITILDMATIKDTEWYKEMADNQESIYCRPTYEHDYKDVRGIQKIISCIRPLQSYDYSGEWMGVLSIDIAENSISEIIDRTNITHQGQVYLLDKKGRVVSATDKALVGTVLGDEQKKELRISANAPGGATIVRKPVEGTGWELVAVIPEEEIRAQSSQLAQYLLLLFVVVTVLAVLTAFAVSRGITRRIRLLIRHVGNIEAEKWTYRMKVDSSDEVGMLQQHFNRMSENMRNLIQEKYKAEVAKKSAELRALQAQINPHFLYNTLELIHWMAMKHKAQDISDIVGRLAKFFRLSLSKGKDVIYIRDEIEHVKTYLEIQNRRFSGKIDYTFEVGPGLEDIATVKLILQPLVENAILHGIQEKEEKRGIILVACWREGSLVKFVVEDDGVGMTEEQVRKITLETLTGAGGYGVHNVAQKIRLYYGDQYGLVYESMRGEGTKVTITFPAVPYGQLDSSSEDPS